MRRGCLRPQPLVQSQRDRDWRRLGDEAGIVGGADALVFGFLVFVVGTLIVVNAWSVLDTRSVADTAAREAARAFVEAPNDGSAIARASVAASAVLDSHGRSDDLVSIDIVGANGSPPQLSRCAQITVSVQLRIPQSRIPLISSVGPSAASSEHTEIVDPWRAGLPYVELGGTICG